MVYRVVLLVCFVAPNLAFGGVITTLSVTTSTPTDERDGDITRIANGDGLSATLAADGSELST
jgi:hypothetical protein